MSSEIDFIHLYEPPQNGSNRTLLVLHGTGGDERSLIPVAQTIDSDAGLLSVRGKVSENGMPRFFRRLAEGVFDLPDLVFRTHELADFIELAKNQYDIDVKNLVAFGYSNGANIASSLLFLRPETLGDAILLRGMVPFEPETVHDLSTKRVFLSAGKHDPIISIDHPDRLALLLRTQGADITLHWNEMDHRISAEELQVARKWLSEGNP